MHDVHLSLLALRHAVEAVQRTSKNDRDRLLGRVLTVARLLRSDRVLALAIQDLERDALAADSILVERAAESIVTQAERIFYELGDLYRDRGSTWRKIVDEHASLVVRVANNETLAAVLDRVAAPVGRAAAGLTTEDLEPFSSNVRPKLLSAIERAGDPAKLNQVQNYLEQLKALAEHAPRLIRFRRLCTTSSLAGIVGRLNRLLEEWERRLSEGPSGFNWIIPDSNGLEEDVALIASRIELYLAGRRSHRMVLFRAKVYFEHFFCHEAREVVKSEEDRVEEARRAGREAQAQREIMLRRHLERFIFQEGFFPITEASASRGRLDLLIAEADAAAIRPLVVEIKQAVRIYNDTIDAKEVEAAIKEARTEISRYTGHLRARPGWEAIEPLVVVFHTSVQDVSPLEDDATILIDIGSRSPSQLRARV